MADDNKVQFELDLDAKEFLEKMLHARESILGLGESENLAGLVEGLTQVGMIAGTLGIAFLALKTTMESVFDAENIKAINQQFEILTQNAGLAGDALKKGLQEAASDLIDDTELTRLANKAIVEMGDNAAKLPEIMNLSRKAAAVMGMDTKAVFEGLNQAVATGNTRLLKQYGIIIDSNKAMQKYAQGLGVTVDALSQSGKQQAILNAVLQEGEKRFAGVSADVKEATDTWIQLKVTLSDIADTLKLAFEKTLGPIVRTVLRDASDAAKRFGLVLKEYLGDQAESSAAHIELLEKKIQDLKNRIDVANKSSGTWAAAFAGEDTKENIANLTKELEQYEAELRNIQTAQKEAQAYGPQPLSEQPKVAAAPKVDYEAKAAQEAKFQEEIAKLRDHNVQMQMQSLNTVEETEKAYAARKVSLIQETDAQIEVLRKRKDITQQQRAEIESQMRQNEAAEMQQLNMEEAQRKESIAQHNMQIAMTEQQYKEALEQQAAAADQMRDLQRQQIEENKMLNEQQKRAAIEQMEMEHQDRMLQIKQNASNMEVTLLNRQSQASNNAAESWAKGFATGSAKARQSLMNFGQQGQAVFTMFGNSAANAFMKLGEGSEKGSQVMRDAVLGMIADIAQYYGTMLLMTSIWPPNPAGLAAGAGLLVLAGFLRSKTQHSAGMDMGSVGGGGQNTMTDVALGNTPQQLAQENQKQAKSVSIEVHGNYFETDQTRTRLTELVRESLDSTDFQVRKIGG